MAIRVAILAIHGNLEVAAPIEEIAAADDVVVSRTVTDLMIGNDAIDIEPLGNHELGAFRAKGHCIGLLYPEDTSICVIIVGK